MEITIEKIEARKEYMKGYREENREKLNAYSREYYKNNKEYYKNYYKIIIEKIRSVYF